MRTAFLNLRRRTYILISVFGIGALVAVLSVFGNLGPFPTNYWPANFLVIPAAAAILFLGIVFLRLMAGRDKLTSTRQVGRVMLHLGLIILLLGVFMSENVVYESSTGYTSGHIEEVAPGIYLQVADINLQYWNHDRDFNMIVTLNVLRWDNSTSSWFITGIGYATITGHPEWGMVSHQVYLDSTFERDLFVAATGFSQVVPGTYQVNVHTKVLPLISFVWLGAFLMVAAMLPIFGVEIQSLVKSLRDKDEHLYDEPSEPEEESSIEIEGN